MNFNEKSYKGHALMALGYTIFGLNIPVVKSIAGVHGITGLSITLYRMAGAAALFWIASAVVGRARRQSVPWRDVGALAVASLFCIFLNQLPFIVGVSLTSPIDAAVITTLVPILTMLFSALFQREPITWLKAAGVATGASGALIFILGGELSGGPGSLVGNMLCVVSAVCFAIYLTAFKRLYTTYGPLALMRWMFLFATILSLPICWGDVVAVDYGSFTWDVWARIVFIVCGATFLTFFLLPIGQRYLRPTVLSMYNYLQPAVASAVAIAAGMDTFGATKGVATLLVFAGVWIVTRSRSRSESLGK